MAGSSPYSDSKLASRVIVFNGDELLIMQRNNHGRKYRTLIGGGIEVGETEEQAALREALEESSIVLANPRKVFTEYVPARKGIQYVFLCDYVSGEPMLAEDSEELQNTEDGLNVYEPMWINLHQLASQTEEYPFITERMLKEIMLLKENSFIQPPKEWTI